MSADYVAVKSEVNAPSGKLWMERLSGTNTHTVGWWKTD